MDGGLRALGGVLYTETGLINVDLGPLLNMIVSFHLSGLWHLTGPDLDLGMDIGFGSS